MTNSHKALAVTVGLAALFTGTVSGAFAQAAAGMKIGTIDRDKVVQGYHKAQTIVDELKRGEEKIQKLVEGANKQYEDAKKANKPPAELEGLQKRLQTQIDDEVRKFQAQATQLDGQVMDEMEKAISAEAAAHKLDVILMKQAVLHGGTDITDGVVKRLAAAAAAPKTK